jgi:hypothetical protein
MNWAAIVQLLSKQGVASYLCGPLDKEMQVCGDAAWMGWTGAAVAQLQLW